MNQAVCLVTGGAGFIGSSLSAFLLEQFELGVVMDNLHPQVHRDPVWPPSLDSRVLRLHGDVTIAADWDRLLAYCKPDVVVHLAAETGTGQSLTQSTRHAAVNVVGTAVMLDAFVRHDVLPKRVILASSRAVYGEGAWRDDSGVLSYPGQRGLAMLQNKQWDFEGKKAMPFFSEETAPHPTSVYGATKLAQEQILTSWALAFGVKPIVLRLQNVYGPGQSLSNPYTGIVSLFCRLAKAGESIPIYEDGRIIRDFVFIDDVVRALLSASVGAGARAGVVYDIGSGVGTSVAELAHLISQYYGAPEPHITGQYRHGDVRHASCSIDLSAQHLDWSPEVSLDTGLAKLSSWIDKESS